jgi:hypothetical protein
MADASRAALDQETDRLRTLALLRAGAAATEPDRGRQDQRVEDKADDEAPDGSPTAGDDDRYTRPGRRDQLPAGARR